MTRYLILTLPYKSTITFQDTLKVGPAEKVIDWHMGFLQIDPNDINIKKKSPFRKRLGYRRWQTTKAIGICNESMYVKNNVTTCKKCNVSLCSENLAIFKGRGGKSYAIQAKLEKR